MDSQKPQKPTEQADVAGLESEGVEIVSDIGEVEAPKVTLEKTQEDLRETLAEIEQGDSDIFTKAENTTSTARPNDSKAPKLYSTASPYIAPKEAPQKAPAPFVPAPHEGSLSSAGSKVLGTGPKENFKKPVIGVDGRINLQSAIEDMIGSDAKKPEPVKPPEPKPEKKSVGELQTESDPSIRAIHTYQSDTEEIVRAQSISVAKMALAEARKNESEGTPIEYIDEERRIHRKRILLGSFSFILFVGGVGAIAYVYTQYINPVAPLAVVNGVTSRPLIESDKTQNVDITNSYNTLKSFADAVTALPSDKGIIANINLIKKVDSGERLATVEEIFGGNNTEMPFRVLKNVDEHAMFGSLVLKNSTPFILFKVSSFSNAWAGMLEWEKKMEKDLRPMIEVTRSGETSEGSFVDEVIANKDTRIIKDGEGDILLYSFINSDTLVITTSRTVLKELVRRVTSATIVQ